MDLANYHIIKVRNSYSRTGCDRVVLRSDRFRQTVTIPYTNEPAEMTNPAKEAAKWLTKNGHKVVGQGEINSHYILIIEQENGSFKPLKD